MKYLTAIGCLLSVAATVPAGAHAILRRADQSAPVVSTSVLVPAGVDLVFVSAILPDAADPAAPASSARRFGDTATQAKSVLAKIARELESHGLTMADVIKMNIFLVGDPGRKGEVDYLGLTQAYLGLYGMRTLEKSLPARTTVQVAGLPVPGVLVAIEVIAAKHPEE